jgi:hypothetical protein
VEDQPAALSTSALPTVSAIDLHVYRAGVIAGVLTFLAFVGVVKDIAVLLSPGERGELTWGFLSVRYTSLSRVWFGYRFVGETAWLAAAPHLLLYGASMVGLAGARRWGWYVALAYVLYIPLSEWTYMFLYPLGYLSGQPYPDPIRWSEWVFLMISFPLEVLAAWLLWWYRDVFVR